MGNMVAFSIRHDIADQLGRIEFDDVSYLHNYAEVLKTTQPTDYWENGFYSTTENPGILSSYYHHADEGADLVFNNEWMLRLPYRLNLMRPIMDELAKRNSAKDSRDDPLDPKIIYKSLQQAIRQSHRKHPLHMRKIGKHVGHKNPCASSYSVFGYLTDCCTDLEKNKGLMPAILEILNTGRVDTRFFDKFSNGFRYLGTFGPEVSCVVSMFRNAFFVMPVPYQPLQVSIESQREYLQLREKRTHMLQDSAHDIAGMNLLANVFGYEVVNGPAPRKVSECQPK